MKILKLSLILASLMASVANAKGTSWIEEGTYNTVVITSQEFNSKNPIYFRLKGPVSFSVCDTGAQLKVELLPIYKNTRDSEYFVKFFSKATGNSGHCKPGEPIETVELVGDGVTGWIKIEAGKSLSLIMPPDYSVELKN